VSIHAKFNPEGVKGRITQPPHNFFKIMAWFPRFHVVISIVDANTQIELRKTEHTIIGRLCSERAEMRAIEEAKNYVLEHWAPLWWRKCYSLTAEQFGKLAKDGMINPVGVWGFNVVSCDRMPDVAKDFGE